MSDHDITDGGRRRIVSEDQAKNLREQIERLRMLEEAAAEHGRTNCFVGVRSRLQDEDEQWAMLGEGSQDPGWSEPA